MNKHLAASIIDEDKCGAICEADNYMVWSETDADGIGSATCLDCLHLLRVHELDIVAAIDERMTSLDQAKVDEFNELLARGEAKT